MLASMTARQFAEWQAFDRLDPIGAQRADFRAATIASTVANGSLQKKGGGQFTPEDFMPQYGEFHQMTAEQSIAAVAAALGSGVQEEDE